VYAPLIAPQLLGVSRTVAPLLFTAVVIPSGWLAVAVKGWLPARTSMLTGALLMALCDFVIAGAAMPGNISDDFTRFVITGVAFAVFLFSVELFVGSTFFELAVAIMPPSLAEMGSALVNGVLSLLALVQLAAFPATVEALSGGPAADARVGFSLCFFGMGAMGLGVYVVLLCFMFPYQARTA
jgi:hypothetical protein